MGSLRRLTIGARLRERGRLSARSLCLRKRRGLGSRLSDWGRMGLMPEYIPP